MDRAMIGKVFILGFLLITSQLLNAADNEENDISVKVGDDIQQLISNIANNGKTLVFEPGTYELNLQLNNNVSLRGRSTKDVIFKSLDKSLTKPTVTVNGATNIKIQNITFLESFNGVTLIDNVIGGSIEIKNNVFDLGRNIGDKIRYAIIMGNVQSVTINNNVFYSNDYAIQNQSAESSPIIKQNIFNLNEIDIDSQNTTNMDANCYSDSISVFANLNIIGNVPGADPNFINPDKFDFHLPKDEDNGCFVAQTLGQPLIEHGAYGGDGADIIPAAVEITTLNEDSLASTGLVTLEWKENNAKEVTGYKVYYSTSPLKTLNTLDSRKDLSSVDASKNTTIDITDLKTETEKPGTPVLTSVVPRDRKLLLEWQSVAGANAYQIYYTGHENKPVTVSGKTSYELTGLSNDQVYTVWLTATAQLQYYFQVVAYTDNNSSGTFSESFFLNDDKKSTLGKLETSEISNKISQQPEAIVAYPELPNEGCFIATAAFNYYSADEVMVLRHFRDKYLLPTEYGRSFVNWYYANGPYAADIIRQSESAKSMTRIALWPVIKMAQWLESSLALFFFVLGLYLATIVVLTRKVSQLALRKF